MPKSNEQTGLSPTVEKVIDQFVVAMRADDALDKDAIDRLEVLLRKDAVPKADEIGAALFKAFEAPAKGGHDPSQVPPCRGIPRHT